MGPMADDAADRQASAAEVRAHAPALRVLAQRVGVTDLRLRDDGTVVVHSADPTYRQVIAFANVAEAEVGAHVQVITDDVPGAVGVPPL